MADRRNWLNLATEPALDPDLPICDSHHHLWSDRDIHAKRYLADDLFEDTSDGHNIVSSIFVECQESYLDTGPAILRPLGESMFAAAQAATSRRLGGSEIRAVIAFADLRLGDAVEEVLTGHEAASGGLFRGIRQSALWDASPGNETLPRGVAPGLLGLAEFREGVAVLRRMNLVFDAMVYHSQLAELIDLASAEPGLTIALNHLGFPLGVGAYAGRRDEVRVAWRSLMAELATLPNTVVKLGGIGMTYLGLGWERGSRPPSSEELAATWAPDINWCIEQFGVDRCMFESNTPVDKDSAPYGVLWNTFKRVTTGASPAEKAALFHDTATRVYSID